MFHRVGSDETYSSTSLALHSWRELPSCTHSYVPKPALDWVRPANNSLRIAVLRVSRNRGASFLSPRRKPSNTDHLLSNSHRETRLYYLIAQLLDGRLGLSRWRGGRFACTSLLRRWSLAGLTVARYDDVNMASD